MLSAELLPLPLPPSERRHSRAIRRAARAITFCEWPRRTRITDTNVLVDHFRHELARLIDQWMLRTERLNPYTKRDP